MKHPQEPEHQAADTTKAVDADLHGQCSANKSGRSQAVRLPKDYPWQTLEEGLAAFEPGFALEREQPDQQQRDTIQP